MNKFTLAIVLAGAMLFMPSLVHAQYSNPNDETCNAAVGKATLENKGELTASLNINLHYENTMTQEKYDTVRDGAFEMIALRLTRDYPNANLSVTHYTTGTTPNLIINADIYRLADGTGETYIEVRGLGLGHLFRFKRIGPTVGDSYINAVTDLAAYFAAGWDCEVK